MASFGADGAQTAAAAEDVEVIALGREGRRTGFRPDRRELWCELALALGFVVCAAAMALLAPVHNPTHPLIALLFVALLFGCLQIEFEVGEGVAHPVQLVLVPMLFVLPARDVPLLVAAAFVLSRLTVLVRAPRRMPRVVPALADGWFSLAPALVFALAGSGRLTAPWLLVAALAGQLGLDAIVSSVRVRIGLGLRLRSHVRAFALTYLVDVLLSPIGLLAALAARHSVLTTLLVLPLGVLLAIFATERRRRIDTALELHRVVGESEARLQSILQHSSDLIAITDADGALRGATGAAAAMLGPAGAAGTGSTAGRLHLLDRVHPADEALVRAFLRDARGREPDESPSATFRLRFADGSWRHVDATASNLLADSRVHGLVLTIRDVNERQALEEQLRHRAFHDALTRLPNRALFYDRIEHALHREHREDEGCAVLFIDVDDFRSINDRFGHDGGDEVLVHAAQRLRACLSSADTAARLSGDEFGVLLEGVDGPAACVIVAERIIDALRAPMSIGDATLTLAPSIGIAIREPGDGDPDELLRQADLAMYAAKRLPEPGLAIFGPELQRADGHDDSEAPPQRGSWFHGAREQRAEIEEILGRPASVRVVVQPIVDLRTGEIAGYEALSRFDTPVSRPPNFWFAQAHRCGLGYELEALAVANALAMPDRPAGTYLSINLSPSAIASPQVQAVLPEDLRGIVVEITENELVSRTPTISASLAALRARGARLAVDDAGSGYAGLKHLMAVAPDLIKLDRALVDGIAGDPAKVALVDSFVGYAERIDALVCAEGIESLDDLALLADLDVSHGQGFGLARPAAPWPSIDAEAARSCRDGLARTLARTLDPELATRVRGATLARLGAQLSEITAPGELLAVSDELAHELGCERVALSFGGLRAPGGPSIADGGAVLHVPIACAGQALGMLEAVRPPGSPWTRRDAVRARLLAGLLGGVLARLSWAHEGDATTTPTLAAHERAPRLTPAA